MDNARTVVLHIIDAERHGLPLFAVMVVNDIDFDFEKERL
jgi:hypothetical protein